MEQKKLPDANANADANVNSKVDADIEQRIRMRRLSSLYLALACMGPTDPNIDKDKWFETFINLYKRTAERS